MPHPHDFMYTGVDNWREPHVCDLKSAMRAAFSLDSVAKDNMGAAARRRILDFAPEVVGAKLKDTIMRYYIQWKKAQ